MCKLELIRMPFAIERNSRVLDFAQSFTGKIILLCAFSVPFHFAQSLSGSGLILFFLLLNTFFFRWSAYLLPLAGITLLALRVPVNYDTPGLHIYFFKIAACAIILIAALYRPPTRLLRNNAHWIFAALLLALVAVGECLSGKARSGILAMAATMSPLVWCLAYNYRESASVQRTLREKLLFLTPAWGHIHFPIPAGQSQLDAVRPHDAAGLATAQIKGIKLAYWGLFWLFMKDLLGWVAYADPSDFYDFSKLYSLHLPNLDSPNLNTVLSDSVAPSAVWLSLLIRSWYYIAWSAGYGALTIATIRMFGYPVFRHMYRPFEATGIFDFLKRIAYYYVQIVRTLFFNPAFYRLRGLPRKPRIFLSVFIAVVGAGLSIKLFQELKFVAQYGALNTILMNLPVLVYYLAVGMLMGAIATFGGGASWDRSHTPMKVWQRALTLAKIIIIYTILLAPVLGWRKSIHSWQEYVLLLNKLMGI
jgi:hypothetical protein